MATFCVENRLPCRGNPLDLTESAALGAHAAIEVARVLALCPRHRETPLRELPGLARRCRIGRLFIKDESSRLGLGSFKALGGAYAVICLALEAAERRLGRPAAPEAIATPAMRAVTAGLTFACASDGNHGKSVAAGARVVGARAVIYLHAGVSAERTGAIEAFGAEVRIVPGAYGDAVAAAARDCTINGWTLVSDTSPPGDERVPRLVMQGYTAMAREALTQLPCAPTHVFLQAGVGGLAAAVASHLVSSIDGMRPRIVVVEPARAACLLASHEAGRRVAVPAGEPTIMAMLDCQEPSDIAWRILARLADSFMTVDEEDASRAMIALAKPVGQDRPIVSGESGAAGLAGLQGAARSESIRAMLGLDDDAVVLLFSTEGATDVESWRRLTGCDPDEVARRAAAVSG